MKNDFKNLIVKLIDERSKAIDEGLINDRYWGWADFSNLDLSGINFRSTNLKGANFENSNLQNCDFYCVYAPYSNFKNAIFADDLQDVNFDHANLDGAKMNSSLLKDSRFVGTSMIGIDISGCDLTCASFIESNLKNAIAHNSELNGTYFKNTNLDGADFLNSEIQDIGLYEMDLIKVKNFDIPVIKTKEERHLEETEAKKIADAARIESEKKRQLNALIELLPLQSKKPRECNP